MLIENSVSNEGLYRVSQQRLWSLFHLWVRSRLIPFAITDTEILSRPLQLSQPWPPLPEPLAESTFSDLRDADVSEIQRLRTLSTPTTERMIYRGPPFKLLQQPNEHDNGLEKSSNEVLHANDQTDQLQGISPTRSSNTVEDALHKSTKVSSPQSALQKCTDG